MRGEGNGEMLAKDTHFFSVNKTNKLWRPNVQHDDYSQQYCIVYLKPARG